MIVLSLSCIDKLLYSINKNNYFYKITRRAEYFVFINNLLFICCQSDQEFSAVNAKGWQTLLKKKKKQEEHTCLYLSNIPKVNNIEGKAAYFLLAFLLWMNTSYFNQGIHYLYSSFKASLTNVLYTVKKG